MKKILVIIGTWPEAIKMCPVVLELQKHNDIRTKVCVTGQHRQMLDQVLDVFQVKADYDLKVMHERQTLFDITTLILERIRPVLEQEKPDVVVLDPPRAGCEERVLAAIAKVKPERVVYVSCNPATLARDLAYMREHGFAIRKVQPCDMFSRTHHVETVVLLTKQKE